jgi:hypothetical protein
MPYPYEDKLEKMLEDTLTMTGIVFDRHHKVGLDFYLPVYDVHVEIKQFHSDRISEQTSRAPNVIVLQGSNAVALFCTFIRTGYDLAKALAARAN